MTLSPLFACLRAPQRPDAVLAVAKEFSPRLQRYGRGCVVLDVAGLGRLLGDPPTIGAELARACAEQCADRDPRGSASPDAPRCAVAPTQVGALLLALAHPRLTVVTEDIAAALAGVPLPILQRVMGELHGVTLQRTRRAALAAGWAADERAFDVWRRWGLATLGDVAALPADAVAARLGQAGVALHQRARGIDPGPLVPDPDVPRFLEHVELEWPIADLEPLAFVLARMLEPLAAALERADRGAVALRLDLRLVDRTTHTRQLQLPAAMRDPRVLRTLLVLDLESHPPSAAIDRVTIEIDPAPGRVLQYSLLERARPSAETLATLTARLGALVGDDRCGTPVLCDSHGPDAFALHRFAPEPDPVPPAAGHRSQRAGHASAAPPCCLRRFRPPRAIRLTVTRGRPAWIAIDRRGMPGGQVEQCAGPWRSSGAWWDRDDRPWDRDEWDIALSDGSLCRVFQARDSGRWFMDGILD